MIDIHNMDTGLPNINNVLARDLSLRVNHRLNKINKDGSTALSASPSTNRMTSRIFILLMMPVSAANNPQRISDQKINFLVLLFAAYMVPGIWKKKYPRKNMEPSKEDMVGVIP